MTTEKLATEVNEVAPSSLAHLVGQQAVVAQVAVALEAARADRRRFDHAMLTGSPGLGKSAVASVIAKEMDVQFVEVLGQTIHKPADLNALLLSATRNCAVHIDEAHELDKRAMTALYLALDQRRLIVNAGPGRRPQAVPLEDFTLLLSTTDEYRLLQPLRDRMRLNLRFQFYSDEELAEVVRQRVHALGWDVGELVLPQIACRARGTPRIALSLLQSAYRVCRAEGGTTVTGAHLTRACHLAEIDSRGLNATERRYLSLLMPGASRLNVLASLLGLPARTVSEVTEAYLLRAGLIGKDNEGQRELTAEGREHVLREAGHGR